MPAKVTLTLWKSGNQGYKVGVSPWKVSVWKNPANGPHQEIEWQLDPSNALTFDKFVIDFKGKSHFTDTKVTSQPALGGLYVATTKKINPSTPGQKKSYAYDIEFYFKDGSDTIKIVLDPDYIVED